MSTCGITFRSAVTDRPLMSLPMASEARLGLGKGLALDDVAQVDGFALVIGHLDATVLLPAMRSMRMLSAGMARHRSSARLVTREYFTPTSSLTS